MFTKAISLRLLHVGRISYAAEKSALATLRKTTGYTFANCKKALELHNNDLDEAEKWLRQEAQKLGWSKANKLEGRSTVQGLIGILIKKNIGALVEVNCETDFVARNSEFQTFLGKASTSCIKYMSNVEAKTNVTKIGIGSDALKNITHEDGKTLGDHLALLIGTVGENATLKRAICYKVPDNVTLIGYTHSTSDLQANTTELLFGKYGAIAAFNSDAEKFDLQQKIVQHIVGLNPKKLGNKDDDKPNESKDDEDCLIYQEFLLDQDIVVGEMLEENGIKVLDFERFACGESNTNQ